jgi:biopolymer transport protein ExbD
MSFRTGGFREPKEKVVLDLTPLIDCIFQLLIFFLLTASFITTPNLGVELPKASSKAAPSQEKDLLVVVTREGQIQFERKTISPAALLDRMKAIHKKRPNARVLIQGDRKSYHGTIVKVMDIAKTVGFRRLGVAIQRRQ